MLNFQYKNTLLSVRDLLFNKSSFNFKTKIKNMTGKESKIRGVIYGTAIGDGFGYLTEFKSIAQIKTKWGEKGFKNQKEIRFW